MPNKTTPKTGRKQPTAATQRKKSPAPPAALPAPDKAQASPDDMPPDVVEFITAIDHYKRKHRRPFPSWSEVLEIVKALGYKRAS
jgi:hypothetical protein